jgi:hypothetical protein
MKNGPVLPRWLKASAEVDLRQVLSGIRPALRTQLAEPVDQATIGRWRRRLGLFGLMDAAGFLVLSRSGFKARRVLTIDSSPGRHEQELGRILGYPSCCAHAAAGIGEKALDDWAMRLALRRRVGRFASLDVRGYGQGRAAISHIPCGPACGASLRMAVVLQIRDAAAWRPLRGRRRWTPPL